jgi:hypothetical protein
MIMLVRRQKNTLKKASGYKAIDGDSPHAEILKTGLDNQPATGLHTANGRSGRQNLLLRSNRETSSYPIGRPRPHSVVRNPHRAR